MLYHRDELSDVVENVGRYMVPKVKVEYSSFFFFYEHLCKVGFIPLHYNLIFSSENFIFV